MTNLNPFLDRAAPSPSSPLPLHKREGKQESERIVAVVITRGSVARWTFGGFFGLLFFGGGALLELGILAIALVWAQHFVCMEDYFSLPHALATLTRENWRRRRRKMRRSSYGKKTREMLRGDHISQNVANLATFSNFQHSFGTCIFSNICYSNLLHFFKKVLANY